MCSSRMKPLPNVTRETPSLRATSIPRPTRLIRRFLPAKSGLIREGSCGLDGVKKCEAVATQAGFTPTVSNRFFIVAMYSSVISNGLNWSR